VRASSRIFTGPDVAMTLGVAISTAPLPAERSRNGGAKSPLELFWNTDDSQNDARASCRSVLHNIVA